MYIKRMTILYNIMYVNLFLTFGILYSSSFILFSNPICKFKKQFYLKDKFFPVFDEKTINIPHNNKLFNKLENSFFAQIGSNPKYTNDEDYHWFDGDGMIHGALFNNSMITYQNRWIQTKRLQTENKWKKKMYLYFGELKGINGILQILKFSFMTVLGFLPQSKGTANTAMLNWKNRIFALHEGDLPYELNISYDKLNISTIGRFNNYKNLYSTTAHPIIDKKRDLLYLYGYNNYDFLEGIFIFNSFDKDMKLIDHKNISLLNNGMTHDVGFTGSHIIIPDMPLKYDLNRIIHEKYPLYFDKENGKTRFGLFNIDTLEEPVWYYFKENFFIFHFSKVFRKNNEYIIYACVMDNLFMEDFVELENMHNDKHIIRGDIRLKEIRLNTLTNETRIIENKYLENLDVDFYYNLDFPIHSKENSKYVYCTIFNSATGYIKGYTRTDIHSNDFENTKPKVYLFDNEVYGNSEPQVVVIKDKEYLLSFTYDNSSSYISLIDVDNKEMESLEIPTRIPPGFHSIYFNT